MKLSLSSRTCSVASKPCPLAAGSKAPQTPRVVATRAIADALMSGAKAAADARAALAGVNTVTVAAKPSPPPQQQHQAMISQDTIVALESELDQGASVAALRRFNDSLRALGDGGKQNERQQQQAVRGKLRRVMHLLAHDLESFNPAFAACVLQVQLSIGHTDYERRDAALKLLIRPLAGEYGMKSDAASSAPQGATHRELFQRFYEDLLKEPLSKVLEEDPAPEASAALLDKMMRDITGAGADRALAEKEGVSSSSSSSSSLSSSSPVDRAVYALGYNLAIEYLADYEKTWMLDSFRALDKALGLGLKEWLFLEVHAEGEAEHAAIGHAATAALVGEDRAWLLRAAMRDHDRDFAEFYNLLADILEQ